MELKNAFCPLPKLRGICIQLVLTFVTHSLCSCFSEQSGADSQREEKRRSLERYTRATGSHSGYALRDGGAVPASLFIQALNGPQGEGDEPELQISLQLGFLSGAILQSTTKSYDWKTGELNARFGANLPSDPQKKGKDKPAVAPSSMSLELQAVILDGKIERAKLVGSLTGETNLFLEPMEDRPFAKAQEAATLSLSLHENPNTSFSALSLKSLGDQTKLPEHSDLPILPGIEAGFIFAGISHLETTDEVYYDALMGRMEIRTGPFSEIIFDQIFTTPEALELTNENRLQPPTRWHGTIYTSAKKVAEVTAEAQNLSLTEQANNKTWMFDGLYGSTQGTVDPLHVRVRFESTGELGSNPGEPVFATFPVMKMSMLLCSGSRAHQLRSAQLFEIDYIAKTARLRSPLGPDAYLYELKFDYDWQILTGVATRIGTGGGTGGPGAKAEFSLQRIGESEAFECEKVEAQ